MLYSLFYLHSSATFFSCFLTFDGLYLCNLSRHSLTSSLVCCSLLSSSSLYLFLFFSLFSCVTSYFFFTLSSFLYYIFLFSFVWFFSLFLILLSSLFFIVIHSNGFLQVLILTFLSKLWQSSNATTQAAPLSWSGLCCTWSGRLKRKR